VTFYTFLPYKLFAHSGHAHDVVTFKFLLGLVEAQSCLLDKSMTIHLYSSSTELMSILVPIL
jgi:hypothetical protein